MSDNTSTLTIELNTDSAKAKAEALASSISSIGAKLEETLKKFTEFQTKLNAINAKVNINVDKINQITGIQQAVDAYISQSKIRDISIKVNAKLVVDKITDISQSSIDKAVKAYNASAPISRQKVNILSDATIEVAKILGEVKGLPAAMRAFNASAPIARQKVSILADASVEIAKIVGEPKGVQAAMKVYNASAPISRQKISLIADASVTVMKIIGNVQGVAAAMRDFNRSVPITTSLIKVWADAKLFIMNVTGVDGRSIRDALASRTTPIEITTPITVVARRIRVIADPTANVTVIVGQLQAAGAATESVTNKTNQWYRKILDVYLIYRVFDSVMSRIQHLWETGLHLAQIETTMSVITGSLSEANKQTEWLMETSNQIGLNFSNAAGPYAKFAAAAKGMFTSTEIKQMYIDLGKVAVAMHLNKEETNGVFLAIQQMASKGTVSLEELRLQFAERIPGAMAIAAASAGMTMTEFTKKVSSGDLGSSFLKKFLTDLAENFKTASDLAANSFIGMQSRFENALFSMTAAVASSGFMQAVGAILDDVAKFATENKKLFEYFGVLLGDTITSVYNDLKKLFSGTDFLTSLAQTFSSIVDGVKSFFNVLSTLQPVVVAITKLFQALSDVIVIVAWAFQGLKLIFLEIKDLLGYDVKASIESTIKTMDSLEEKSNQIEDSLFSLSDTKIDLNTINAITELRKLQAEIKVTESDYKLLSDKFGSTIKASKAAFTPTANETVTTSVQQGISIATPENIDKLNSKVKDSTKNIVELGTTVDKLNFDQKGKSLADSLNEYLKLANPDLEKDAARLQKEFNALKDSLKLTPEDFVPRQVTGKFSEVLDEELASSKVKADILKGALEAAQADLAKSSSAVDARIADLQDKRSKLVPTGRGSAKGDPEYAKQLDAEIAKAKEYKAATEGIRTSEISRLQNDFKNTVERGNNLDSLLKELLSLQDKSTEALTANATKLFEHQSKITTELEKELGIRNEMVNKTDDLIRKEEQRKKILAIETGAAPEVTLTDLIKARYQAQVDLDKMMKEHKKLSVEAATAKKEEYEQSKKVLEVLKSQNAVEGLKALSAEKTAVSAEVQADLKINTENMSINAKAFMDKYSNELQKAAKELNVSPALIAAQAALETGYGAKIVKNAQGKTTNNLFNIKDFSGGGVLATDNATKSRDPYKQYADIQGSFDDYVAKLKRLWPGVVGSQTPEAFGKALKPGEKGGYAEDINYIEKLSNVAKNFGIISKDNASIIKDSTKAQTELNKSYVVTEQEATTSYKALEDQVQVNKDLEDQILKVSEARNKAIVDSIRASRDLEIGKESKFKAAEQLDLSGSLALPLVQSQIDEARTNLDDYTSLVRQYTVIRQQLVKEAAGAAVPPEQADFTAKAIDQAGINVEEFTKKAADAKSKLEGLTQAKESFSQKVLQESANLKNSTEAMVNELKYGADYAERLRLGKISPELVIEFDKNKTTRDFYEFAKAAGTSIDGLKDTFASVFIAMGDTTKSFTESMADMFDNMVNRMLDASAKLMANGLLDWYHDVQGGGTNFLLGAIGTAVSLGVKFLTKTPSRSAPSTAQTGDSSALGIASMRAADVFGRDTAFQFDTVTAAQYNANLKTLAGVAYDNSKNIVEFLSNIGDTLGVSGAASYVKDLFSPITNVLTKGSALIDSATSSFSSSFTGLSDKYITPAFDYFGKLIGVSSTTAGFAGLQGGSIASSWSAGISQLPSASWTAGTNGIYSFGQTGGTFAGSVQAGEVAGESAVSAGFSEALGPAAATVATFKAAWDIVNIALDDTASFGEQAAVSLYGVRDAALAWALAMPALAPILLPVAAIANITGSVSDMIDGDFKRGLRNMIFGPLGDIIAELTGFLKSRTPNAWINQFNPLGAGYTPEKMAPITAQAPGYKALDEGIYQRGTNKGLFIGTETRLGSVELSYHEIHRKTDMTELDTQFKALLKLYRKTNNVIATSLDAIDFINKESVSTVGLFLGKLGDGEEKNRIALKQELSDLDTGNMTDKLYSSISERLRETGTKAGMIWSTIFDNLTVAFKNISADNSVFAAGAANLASLLAIPLNQFSVQVVDDLTKSIKAPAVGGNIADVQKELETNVVAFKQMFAVINDPQFGIGAGVSDTKISGLISSWSKLGLGIEETSNSWIAFVDLFHKSQPTLDVKQFETEMTKAWDGLIKKFVDTGLTQVQAVSMTSSAVVGASVLKEKGVADKDLLQGGLAFAEAARKAATKNLEAANIAVDDAIAKGKAEGTLKASMSREQMTAILVRTKAIDQQTAIEADFSVQQAKATQTLLEGYGAIFSVVNGLGLNLADFGLTVSDIPNVVDNLTNSFGEMSKAVDFVRANIKRAFGDSALATMDLTNAFDSQKAAIEKSPILKAAGFTAGMGLSDIQNRISSLTPKDQKTAKELVASAGAGSPIAIYLAGAEQYDSANKSLAESTKQVDKGLIYIDNQLVKSTDKVTEAFGSLREGIDSVGNSLTQFASETNRPILSKSLAEFQLSSIINKPELKDFFKGLDITPQNASSRLSDIANQYASNPTKLAADAGALVPIISNNPELKSAFDTFMTYAAQQMNAINDANKSYDDASKQAADNANTLADKQKDINDQVKDFAASDANKKIMAVNKEITNLADEATKLGGALTDLETLRMLKLGNVYKDLYDSVEPLLEISNKLGMTNVDLTTAMTKDQNGLWHFSQSMLDLLPILSKVTANLDNYKASLTILGDAYDTVVKAGMGSIETSVTEAVQKVKDDMLALAKTPELNTQQNRSSIVEAANVKGLNAVKSYIDEFDNLGLNSYSKSVKAVNKEFDDLAKGLLKMATELNWTQDQVDTTTAKWNELKQARIDELNKKLVDSLKAVYTTFSRLDATSLESELYGLSDSFSATIRDIVDNGATLQQAASVINIALITGYKAFEKASKATKDAYAKNYKDLETRYLDIADTIAANAAKAKLDASLSSLSLVDPTDKAYSALAAGSAQAQYDSDMLSLAMTKQQRAVEKLNASQYKSTMTTDEANQAYQDQTDAVNTLIQLTNDRYTTEVDNYKRLADAAKGIRDFIKQFKLSDLATLSPEAKLAEARAQYSVQLVAAQAGDTTAMGSVTGAFNTYAEAAKAYYASTTPYQEIIAKGLSDLSQLGAPETIDISEKIATATQTTADRLRILQDVLKGIDEQQRVRLSNDLASLRASTEKVGAQFQAGIIDLAASYGVSADQLFSAVNSQGTTAAAFLGSSSGSLKTIADNTSAASLQGAILGALVTSKTSTVTNTPDQLAVNDMTKTFYTKIQNDSLLAFSKSEAGAIYSRIAAAGEVSRDILTRLGSDSLLAFSAARAQAIYDRIANATEVTAEAAKATSHNIISLGEVMVRLAYNWDPSPSYRPIMTFATGGAFRSGVVDRPTAFSPGLMGEAGAEGILPLANIGGKLGVHASASDSATTDAVIETGKANTEELRRMREETTALQKEMIAKLVMLERRMAQIESAGALVGAM